MKEFEIIHRYFAPLAGEAGLGLRDDAALLTPPAGKQLVITQDAMTAGVHFFADDPADLIARKLLRVNLSDLAAKGAAPLGYLLSLLLPENTNEEWIAAFAKGLAQDQQKFGITLMGGDTSKINGPLTLSLTAIGTVDTGAMWRRSGAKAGDWVYVTGTIGDAALGLKVRSQLSPHRMTGSGFAGCRHEDGMTSEELFLLNRYLLPQPRFLPVTRHQSPVTSCMDISDGLVQDAEHLAKASGVKLVIEAEKLPLSEAAKPYQSPVTSHQSLLTGGDDYELLLTASAPLDLSNLTLIGRVEAGEGVAILDKDGTEISFAHKGWQHF